jgi:peptide/nickel transport system substrate-binding protein
MFRNKRWLLTANLVLAVVLVATACGTPAPAPTAPPAVETPAAGETPVPTTPPTPAPPPAVEVKNPGTYVECVIGEPESLDPPWTYETSGAEKEMLIYEGMIFFDRDKINDFVPALATEVPTVENGGISEDGLTYTFKIRQGVTFHEGGTLEPHDVAYSLQRGLLQDRVDGPQVLLLNPILNIDFITDLVDSVGEKEACETVQKAIVADDEAGTVTLHLAMPFAPLLQILAQPWGSVMDKEWMIEQGEWDGTCDNWMKWHDPPAEGTVLFNKANGTGPYKLESWSPGEEIVLVRNENYWRTDPIWEGGPSGPASIERVVYRLIEEWGTRFAAVQAGDCDTYDHMRQYSSQADELVREVYTGGIPDEETSDVEILHEDGMLKLFKGYPLVQTSDFFMNFEINVEGGNPYVGSGALDGNGIPPDFFSDIHVRKAFNYCFDRDTYIQEVELGEAIPHRGPIISGAGILGYDPNSFIYTYDPAKCEEELKLAWDGQLWDTGMYMQLVYNTGNDSRKVASEILADGLMAVNPDFSIAVVNVPWPTYLGARTEGRLPIHLTGWLEDFHHPHNWVVPYMGRAGAFSRAQKFPDEMYAEFQDLIDQGVREQDQTAADAIYKKLQQLANDYAIDIFISQPTGRRYFQRWIHGWYYNPLYPGIWVYALTKE